jgi:protein-disulfide isomerase
VIVGVAFAVSTSSDTTGETPDAVPAGTTDDFGVLVGDDSTPTQVVVYADPQCPVCAQFEAATGDRVNEAIESGDAQVEYRIVSFLDDASTNDYSSRAANALMAVQDTAGPDVFASFFQILYENQTPEGGPGHDDDQLIEYAVEAGADEGEIRPQIEDKIYEQWLVNATEAMSKNGVTGTPTVFVDGERLEDPVQGLLDALG